jgi:23S rRNA U2552 (ribose-2'-O)-methylase RlmE/FtsJ
MLGVSKQLVSLRKWTIHSVPHSHDTQAETPVDDLAATDLSVYNPSNACQQSQVELLGAKQEIDKIVNTHGRSVWGRLSKVINPYETVTVGVANALGQVPSRSFCKMWEMIEEFQLLKKHSNNPPDQNTPIVTAHLCEGPGGFIDAVEMCCFLKKRPIKGWVGITLRATEDSHDATLPDFNMANFHTHVLADTIQREICYGKDGTGDITNAVNLVDFACTVEKMSTQGQRAHLVTSDGGFDVSCDYNRQEEWSAPLIFCQVVGSILAQDEGGNMVCKIFDTFRPETRKIVALICALYREVRFFKPTSSRPCNSERYIIALFFRGVDKNTMRTLLGAVQQKNGWIIKSPDLDTLLADIDAATMDFTSLQIKSLVMASHGTENEHRAIRESQQSNVYTWMKRYGMVTLPASIKKFLRKDNYCSTKPEFTSGFNQNRKRRQPSHHFPIAAVQKLAKTDRGTCLNGFRDRK